MLACSLLWCLIGFLLFWVCNTQLLRNSIQDGFDVSKHRKYEIRSGKLKQQEAKIRSAQQKLSNLNKRYSLDGMRFCNASMPYPHSFLSRKHFDGAVIDMTNDERKGRTKCTFLGATCPTEAVEHALVANYLIPDDSVLETGARYGTTSCTIAHRLSNSGQLVCVEPDHRVWNLLDENGQQHHCNFWLLRGVIADRPATISGTFYSTRSVSTSSERARQDTGGTTSAAAPNVDRCPPKNEIKEVSAATSRAGSIMRKQHYSFEEIQSVTNVTFTALLIDCEGCIESMFAGNVQPMPVLLRNIRTIILEADMPIGAPDCTHNCVDYAKWIDLFESVGLKTVYKQQDPIYTRIYHYVFRRM